MSKIYFFIKMFFYDNFCGEMHALSTIYQSVLFKGSDIFLLFLKGVSEISLTRGRIKSCIYEVKTLHTKES